MPSPRVRIRILMVASAILVIASMIGRETLRLGSLAGSYRQRADEHSQFEAMYRSFAATSAESAADWAREANFVRAAPLGGFWMGPVFTLDDLLERSRNEQNHVEDRAEELEQLARTSRANAAREAANARYYARLRAKYDRAARRPWLRIAPDPPLPE